MKALEIRRQLYADEANDDTASTLYNIGHLLSRMGGRENMRDTVKYHEECVSMYRRLGGVSKLIYHIGIEYQNLPYSYVSVSMEVKHQNIICHWESHSDLLICSL